LLLLSLLLIFFRFFGWMAFSGTASPWLASPGVAMLLLLITALFKPRLGKWYTACALLIYFLGMAFAGWGSLVEREFHHDESFFIEVLEFTVIALLTLRNVGITKTSEKSRGLNQQ
jgi:hypothetical protein